MPKVLMILAPENFRDAEYFEPKKIFESNNFEIETASKIAGEITGADGKTTNADKKVQDIDIVNFDAIVFAGGPGMLELTSDPEFVNLAKKFFSSGKLTAAICAASAVLANSGVLKGKKATGWSGIANTIKDNGGIYTASPVEIDQNLVTADGPQSAKLFGEKIVEYLKLQN